MKKSKNLAKKLTALALSATLFTPDQSSKAIFGIFGGNKKGRILSTDELLKKYTDEDWAKLDDETKIKSMILKEI